MLTGVSLRPPLWLAGGHFSQHPLVGPTCDLCHRLHFSALLKTPSPVYPRSEVTGSPTAAHLPAYYMVVVLLPGQVATVFFFFTTKQISVTLGVLRINPELVAC